MSEFPASGAHEREVETLHRLARGISDIAAPRDVLSHALGTLLATGWFSCGEAAAEEDGRLETVAFGPCRHPKPSDCPLRPQLEPRLRRALERQELACENGWWLVPIDTQAVLALAGGDVSQPFFQACLDIVRASVKRARLQSRLADKERQRSRLLQALLSAQEAERLRVARDLHDQIGQGLTGLLLCLDAALGDPSPERLRELKALAVVILADVGRLALGLRPSVLDELGLEAALRRYAHELGERYGLEVALLFSLPCRLSRAEEVVLYRVAQEALTNVVRHARAARASLLLSSPEPGAVQLVVEDEGVGFAPEQLLAAERVGLTGMRERLELLGGWLELESAPGRGCTLYARLPLGSAP